MNLIVNGHDWLPLLTKIGFKRNDLDGPNAGRTMDGTMYRDRVASKLTLELEFRTLTDTEMKMIHEDTKDEFFTVHVTDPRQGDITIEMYTNNVPYCVFQIDRFNGPLWEEVAFNLIQR